jgi:MinD-like ATPase involved in chromosome partitioning or flagellar assembly
LDYVGFLPFDKAVPEAVLARTAFLDLYPQKGISKKIIEIAETFLAETDKAKGSLQFFMGTCGRSRSATK